ncbi:hypothetical protein AL755_01595 (plasmid) [Arthrobacter sp. ERGS1:01]|nr:hypothetical protein AL755_01595 [Arthrobacter sp. ERGS1:01]
MAALDKNRVNHAYLFSGPRGCGKTTSARILARCLNCAQGPTSHPCGTCDSCVELARGGAGSLDVIEIDAASHGGVDDARDLRERATFAPIRDRYKIFIIDEAHMVTSAGFNALLKIVEEPPEHIKFIFATTEPDKVIGTIRSRTHHYPFRLVPPEPLMAYLAQLCEAESVPVAPGVLSLVIRAGGGSVRDSLSVLDQLMAGAGAAGLDYELAVDLLGYTHASLLDDVVEALAASDSATVFKSVDRVIQTGHDPRRFVEDLLERFRDLIIVAAMPESAHAILRGTPDELIARMQNQAAQLGAAELSRAADVTNSAFNEMTGATSPRLHLELLGARLLLPGADSSARGMAARLDQMERRLNYGGTPGAAADSSPAPAFVPDFTQGSTPAPAFAAPAAPVSSGGGLAAVRAQLAKAKEAAGAEVANRNQAVKPESEAPAAPAAEPAAVQPPAAQSVPVANAAPAPEAPSDRATAAQATAAASWGDLAPAPAEATWADLDAAPSPRQTSDWEDAPRGSAPESAPAAVAPQAAEQIPAAPMPVAAVPADVVPAVVEDPASVQAPAAQQAPSSEASQAPAQQTQAQQAPAASPAPANSGGTGIEIIRRAWPEILTNLGNIRKVSWAMVNQNVVPQAFDGQTLRIGLPSSGLIEAFSAGGHADNLRQAIHTTLGISCQLVPVTGDAPSPGSSAEPNPKGLADRRTPVREVRTPSTSAASPVQPVSAAPVAAPAAAPAPAPAPAPSVPAVAVEPVAPVAAVVSPVVAPVAAPEPVATQPAAPQPAAQASTPAAPARPGARVSDWDGPIPEEPNWDDEPPHDDWAPEPPRENAGAANAMPHEEWAQAESRQPVPHAVDAPAAPAAMDQPTAGAAAQPAAPYRPKVSPISAWTTGWDLPAETPAAPVAEEPSVPRRSQLLAAQAQQEPQQDSPQDWGVSLGATSRNRVADPGWGAPASAPDWAQPAPQDSAPQDSAQQAPAQAEPPAAAAPAQSTPAQSTQTAPAPVRESGVSAAPASPAPAEQPAASEAPGGKMSMYQRLANSPEAKAGRAQSPARAADTPYVEDVPSPDDVTLEESGVVGQAAVERILGGALIEERPLNGGS